MRLLRRIAPVSRSVGALALLLLPAVASAHTSLRRSDPERGSRLRVAPARIQLWFTARPQLAFSRIVLIGPAGPVPLERLSADTGNALRVDVRGALAPGEYTVAWQTASADGHLMRGEFVFAVLAPGDTSSASHVPPSHERHAADPAAHGGHSEYRIVRWIEFLALLVALGVLGFRHAVLPPLAARGVFTADAGDRARRIGQRTVAIYGVAALVRLYTESVAVHGTERAFDPSDVSAMLTTTVWGIGWSLGFVGAVTLLMGWRLSRHNLGIGTPLAFAGAAAMIVSPGLSGHAAAADHAALAIVFDALHVASAGVWVGGLFVLLAAGIPAMRRLQRSDADVAVSALVNSFHPIALVTAPMVVAAGLASALMHVPLAAVTTTEYGRALLTKTVVVVPMLVLGAYHAIRVRRTLGDTAGTKRIRITAATEVALGVVVIALTTILITSPPPTP